MPDARHTPGPWAEDGCTDTGRPACGEARYHQIDAPTPKGLNPTLPYTVADTLNRHHCITPEEDAANAHLIAAAPELLEALIEAGVALLNYSADLRFARDEFKLPLCTRALERVRAAIAKAVPGTHETKGERR